jgi:hypothetical protein
VLCFVSCSDERVMCGVVLAGPDMARGLLLSLSLLCSLWRVHRAASGAGPRPLAGQGALRARHDGSGRARDNNWAVQRLRDKGLSHEEIAQVGGWVPCGGAAVGAEGAWSLGWIITSRLTSDPSSLTS